MLTHDGLRITRCCVSRTEGGCARKEQGASMAHGLSPGQKDITSNLLDIGDRNGILGAGSSCDVEHTLPTVHLK